MVAYRPKDKDSAVHSTVQNQADRYAGMNAQPMVHTGDRQGYIYKELVGSSFYLYYLLYILENFPFFYYRINAIGLITSLTTVFFYYRGRKREINIKERERSGLFDVRQFPFRDVTGPWVRCFRDGRNRYSWNHLMDSSPKFCRIYHSTTDRTTVWNKRTSGKAQRYGWGGSLVMAGKRLRPRSVCGRDA